MPDIVKIAAVQMNPVLKQNRENLDRILSETEVAAQNGADLVAFPECALTGYMFSSREEALPYMETIPGPSTDQLEAVCRQHKVHVVIGMLERDGDRCFNSAILVGPHGLIGSYRKSHLPFLGIDRFLDHGNRPFKVWDTTVGRVGLFICYDCHFPESARVLTLLGAEILVLPTNWPEGRDKVPRFVINTRAYENKVNIVAVDRVGSERDARFVGKSLIVDTMGDTLAQAGREEETIIYGEISLSDARQKHVVFKPGEFEANFIGDRRPELYGKISEVEEI
jgi:predicted amidohydrolase